MDRRMFLRYSLSLGAFWTLESLLSSCAHSPSKTLVDNSILQGVRIIDAHAHPDQFHLISPSRIDESSTIQKIRTLGMAASVFAAVGDLPYFLPTPSTTPYINTKGQLKRAPKFIELGKVNLIRKAADVPRIPDKGYIPGAILAIEGGDPLEGRTDRVDEFYQLGVRVITLVHYQNNELGDIMTPWIGSYLPPGPYNNGLTRAGRKVIERMQEIGMIVDVAHAHPLTLKQIVEMDPNPLLDSHTNPCPIEDFKKCWRMRTWKDMELIAKTGGVICTWPVASIKVIISGKLF